MPQAVDDPLYSGDQVCSYYGLSPYTLEAWRHRGKPALPYIKVGRCVRYRKSAVEKFLADNTVTSTAEDKARRAQVTN